VYGPVQKIYVIHSIPEHNKIDNGLPEHRKYKHHDITQMSKAPNYNTFQLPQETGDKHKS
jgi:hypothetical protein